MKTSKEQLLFIAVFSGLCAFAISHHVEVAASLLVGALLKTRRRVR